MGESLNPSALSRLSRLLRPDWSRTLAARRVAAAGLVVLAAVAAFRSDPHGDRADAVVATRDLAPGVSLTADDVRVEKRLATTIPDGARAGVGPPNSSSDVESAPHVVATDAVVVLVSPKPAQRGPGNERVVLVALPAATAHRVAGVALVETVTLTFH